MKYDNEELELLNAIENDKIEKIDFNNEDVKQLASDTLSYLNEKNKLA